MTQRHNIPCSKSRSSPSTGVARIPMPPVSTRAEEVGSLWHALKVKTSDSGSASFSAIQEVSREQRKVTASLSPRTLLHETCALAAVLSTDGCVTRGDRVAVMLRNAPIHVVAQFAIAGVGGIAVSCNTRLTATELRTQIADSGANVIIADETFAHVVREALDDCVLNSRQIVILWAPHDQLSRHRRDESTFTGGTSFPNDQHHSRKQSQYRLILDTTDFEFVDNSNASALPWFPKATSAQLASNTFQFMFTSGTTGRPKGVVHTQWQVSVNAWRAVDMCGFIATDVWLHAAPMYHAMDAFAMYAGVFVGANQITIAAPTTTKRTSITFCAIDAVHAIADRRVTATAMTAMQLALLLDHLGGNSPADDIRTLRLVSCGGSEIDPELVAMFLAIAPSTVYFTDYGMTEAGGRVCVSLTSLSEEAILCALPARIQASFVSRAGRAATGVEVIVARRPIGISVADKNLSEKEAENQSDSNLELVHNDGEEVGEVLIRGATVFEGYWDSNLQAPCAATSAGAFESGGWFRTGDAAVVDAHGWITVVDRVKDIVITGGENVFCHEVETTLRSHPAIIEAAVYSRPDPLLGELVEAAVVTRKTQNSGRDVTERELLAHCGNTLASYKLPHVVLFVEALPTTSTGKVRKELLRDAAAKSSRALDLAKEAEEPDLAIPLPNRALLVQMIRKEIEDIVPFISNTVLYETEDIPLAHVGLHSAAAVELARRLSALLRKSLPSLLVFNHSTVGAIAEYLSSSQSGVSGSIHNQIHNKAMVKEDTPPTVVACHSSALPAMPMTDPSGMNDPQTSVPMTRWDIDQYVDHTGNFNISNVNTVRHAAFFQAHVGECDPDVIGMGTAEVLAIDPTHRLLTEHAMTALIGGEKYSQAIFPSCSDTISVYVGCMWQEYEHVVTNVLSIDLGPALTTGSSLSFLAGRVSFTLNLRGECAAIDTACSSSMVAMHFGHESMRTHLASLVSGVSLMLLLDTHAQICQLGALSPTGRCKTLDMTADGYGRGEGCVVFVVRALSDLISNVATVMLATHARCGIAGTAVNQDGRSSSLTTPNGASQQALLRIAATRANTERLSSVTIHGTATPLGDPIEVAALSAVFCIVSQNGDVTNFPLHIQAPKSVLGHLEGAAGTHAILKTISAMNAASVSPIAHLRTISTHVVSAFGGETLKVPSERAAYSLSSSNSSYGVSAFGMSGVNSHSVICLTTNGFPISFSSAHYALTFRQIIWPRKTVHTVLGEATCQNDKIIFTLSNKPEVIEGLMDHRVCGCAILPAAMSMSAALAATQAVYHEVKREFSDTSRALTNVTFVKPLFITGMTVMRCELSLHSIATLSTTFGENMAVGVRFAMSKYRCTATPPIATKLVSSRNITSLHSFHIHLRGNICRSHVHTRVSHGKMNGGCHPSDKYTYPRLIDVMMHAGVAAYVSLLSLAIPTAVAFFQTYENDIFSCPEWALTLARDQNVSNHALGDGYSKALGLITKKISASRYLSVDPNLVLTSEEAPVTSSSSCYYLKRLAIPSRVQMGYSDIESCQHLDSFSRYSSTVAASSPSHHMAATCSSIALLQQLASRGSIVVSSVDVLLRDSFTVNDTIHGIMRTATLEYSSYVSITTIPMKSCDDAGVIYQSQLCLLSNNSRVDRTHSQCLTLRDVVCCANSTKGVVMKANIREVHNYMRRLISNDTDLRDYQSSRAFFITGGVGALGSTVAFSMLKGNPTSCVTLPCRSGRTRNNMNKYAAVRHLYSKFRGDSAPSGVVILLKCDIASIEEFSEVTENARSNIAFYPRGISDVVHAAGALSDAYISRQCTETIRCVMAPKIPPVVNSERRLAGGGAEALNSCVFFSSIAALFGSMGQVGYSGANSALDGVTMRLRRGGRPVASVQWGAWSEDGMAARSPNMLNSVERMGIGLVTPLCGVAVFTMLLRNLSAIENCKDENGSNGIIAASNFDWSRIVRHLKPLPAVCQAVCADMVIPKSTVESVPSSFDVMQAGVSSGAISKNLLSHDHHVLVCHEHVEDVIIRTFTSLTGNHNVAIDEPLMSAGLDSLTGAELQTSIDTVFGTELPATAIYDYPTIYALTQKVCNDLGLEQSESFSSTKVLDHSRMRLQYHNSARVLLITGSSSRAPTRPFIPNTPATGDSITCIPRERWDMQAYQDKTQKLLPSLGGFMHYGIDFIDIGVFGVAQIEATLMDPQHRILLEMFEHARTSHTCTLRARPDDRDRNQCNTVGFGAYVGIADQGYQHSFVLSFWGTTHPYIATGNTLSCAAGRLCFVFAMHGPALSVDTACSSSIVSTHLASAAMTSTEIDRAAACGTHSILAVSGTATFSAAGMLSEDARCKTMDASADGYVRGESAGVLILEVSGTAEIVRDNDVAMILSTAVNQDGRSSGLTAPSGLAQQAVIRVALAVGSMLPENMSSLQLHGTGTSLGDPIEFGASLAVLRRSSGSPLVLEAVKSFIGHTECASGIIGLMQPLLSLNEMASSKILHLTDLNPHVVSVLKSSKYMPSLEADALTARQLVRISRQNAAAVNVGDDNVMACGVGSFAFQGTNGQAIMGIRFDSHKGPHNCAGAVNEHVLFDRQRHWVLPQPHAALRSFASPSFDVHIKYWAVHAKLDVRLHAHFWDHKVLGRVLFPGAGFLEAAVAGTLIALPTDYTNAADIAITKCILPLPMLLPIPPTCNDTSAEINHNQRTTIGLAWCMLNGSPKVEISSILPRSFGQISSTHFMATVTMLERTHTETMLKCGDGKIANDANFVTPQSLLSYFMAKTVISIQPVASGGIRAPAADNYLDYHIHPACIDNAMQLAGAISEKGGDDSTLKVPAGVEAFAAPLKTNRTTNLNACGENASSSSRSLQATNHELACALGGRLLMRLLGLGLKEMRAATKMLQRNMVATKTKKMVVKINPSKIPIITYSLEWLAYPPPVQLECCKETRPLAPPHSMTSSSRRAHPADAIALFQIGSTKTMVNRALVRTAGGVVAISNTPISSDLQTPTKRFITTAAMHGMARTVAQECRKCQIDSVDVDATSNLNREANIFAVSDYRLGVTREKTTRGGHWRSPNLTPLNHGASLSHTSSLRPAVVTSENVMVRILATSASIEDVTWHCLCGEDEDVDTAKRDQILVGFVGTVMESCNSFPTEVGTAVFGVMRSSSATTISSSALVSIAECRLLPQGIFFESAAALPGPHVLAHACLQVALSLDKKLDNIIVLQDYLNCPVSRAAAAQIDDEEANTDRVHWVSDPKELPLGHKATAVFGYFDTKKELVDAFDVLAFGGTLVKMSRATVRRVEAVREIIVGCGVSSGAFLREDGPELDISILLDTRPDIRVHNLVDLAGKSVQSSTAALDFIARSFANWGTSGGVLSHPYVTLHPAANRYSSVIDTGSKSMKSYLVRHIVSDSANLLCPALVTLSCDPIPFSYAGTRTAIVITGGLGSLSLETSTWLARHGSIDIRLLSRAGRGKITHELRNCSGVVTIDRADTSSLEECANVFADVSTGAINSHRLPAGSLIHAAGILRDAMLVRQKMDSVLDVFGAKSSTIVRLKAQIRPVPLYAIVLFSSVASLMGSAGQTNYAGANAALDRLAERTRGQGKPAISIQWGAWGEIGMAADNDHILSRIDAIGMGVLQPWQGVMSLFGMLENMGSIDTVAVSPFSWEKLGKVLNPLPDMCRDLVNHVTAKNVLTGSEIKGKIGTYELEPAASIANEPSFWSLPAIQFRVMTIINDMIARDVEPDEPLIEAGLDSLSGDELKSKIEITFGVEIPQTAVFDYPNSEAMSEFIYSELAGSADTKCRNVNHSGNFTKEQFEVDPQYNRITTAVGSSAVRIDIQPRVENIISELIGRDIGPDEPLIDAGLDSLSGLELKSQMENEFEVDLPETVIFDYPTTNALVTFIIEQQQDTGRGAKNVSMHGDIKPRHSQSSQVENCSHKGYRSSKDTDSTFVLSRVLAILSELIGRTIDQDEPLIDAGIDSLSGAGMKTQLESEFHVCLPETALYDYPSAAALSSFICKQVNSGNNEKETRSEENKTIRPYQVRSKNNVTSSGTMLNSAESFATSTAVSDASFVLPSTPRSGFIADVSGTGDAISRVPRERWDMQQFWDMYLEYEATSALVPPFGSFIDQGDIFDASLFGISRAEAIVTDPQHRWLLEGVLHVQAHAMPTKQQISDLEGEIPGIGVYVGISGTDYLIDQVLPTAMLLNAFILPGNVLSVAAGRISFIFGFRGPSLAVDTACSASIVSTHVATRAMQVGDIFAALSCGVSAIMSVLTSGLFTAAGMLSPEGRCKTLDASANGYVRGEARGVIFIECIGRHTFSRTMSFCVFVIGSSVNQDGRSSSLTAPNGPSQQSVICAALRDTNLDATDVTNLQMHGTGTPLGDPIEVGAVVTVYKRAIDTLHAPLKLEAVKSHVGHTETAAGMVGVAQPLNDMLHACTAAMSHLRSINPHVISVMLSAASKSSAETSAVSIQVLRQQSNQILAGPVTSTGPSCGISGFAFQGTNSHVVLQAQIVNVKSPIVYTYCSINVLDCKRQWVVPMSAHTLLSDIRCVSPQTSIQNVFLDPRKHHGLWDHRVMRHALFPAAGFMDLATSGVCTLGDCMIADCVAVVCGVMPVPLLLPETSKDNSQVMTTVIQLRTDSVGSNVEIVSERKTGNPHLCAHVHYLAHQPGACDATVQRTNDFLNMLNRITFPSITASPLRKGLFAHGSIEDLSDNYTPFRIEPSALDNMLQLAAASHVVSKASNQPRLIIPTGFSAFSARMNHPGGSSLRASVHVPGNDRDNFQKSKMSSHELTSPRSAALGRLRNMEVRAVHRHAFDEMTKQSKKHALKPTQKKHSSRRAFYRIIWDAQPRSVTHVSTADSCRIARLATPSKLAASLVRATAGSVQTLQARINTTKEVSISLSTRDAHPFRPATTVASNSNPGNLADAVWGVWTVAATEMPSSSSLNGMDYALVDTYSIHHGNNLEADNLHSGLNYGGACATPRLVSIEELNEDITVKRSLRAIAPPTPFALGCEKRALVTGGLGAIALNAAIWLVGHQSNHRHISDDDDKKCAYRPPGMHPILVSRTGRSAEQAFGYLVENCFRVIVAISADISVAEDAFYARVITGRDASLLFHAAGLLRDAILTRQTAGDIRVVAAPKSVAFLRHFRPSRDLLGTPLDASVSFSSIASFFGSIGQAPYAAANASLEGLAIIERVRGAVNGSCAFGAWKNTGMAANGGSEAAEKYGYGALSLDEGVRALAFAASSGGGVFPSEGRMIVTPIEWLTLSLSLDSRITSRMSVFNDFLPGSEKNIFGFSNMVSEGLHVKTQGLRRRTPPAAYAHLHGDLAVEAVTNRLLILLAESTNVNIQHDDPLMESGLDSVAGIELQQRAETEFNVKLEPTAALDNPTAAALGRHIVDVMGLLDKNEPDEHTGINPALVHFFDRGLDSKGVLLPSGRYGKLIPIATAAAVYAGGVDSTESFLCQLVHEGTDPQKLVPLARYDIERHYDPLSVREIGVVTVRHGAFLESTHTEHFDATLFRMSSTEALHMDPQQRLLLETCLRTCAVANLLSLEVKISSIRERTGVYVGCMYNEVPHLQREYGVDAGAYAGTGSGSAFMCGRMSYCLDLSGPCISTDTACSSSLVSTHLAWREVGMREADAGLVAGVNLTLLYINTSVICAIGALSRVGRCKTMDTSADGYGRGEGCGVFVIGGTESLVFIENAMLAGSAINQDGRSSALTAPHGPSQKLLLLDVAREEAATSVHGISDAATSTKYIATHGTGTNLGDPIEAAAIARYVIELADVNTNYSDTNAKLLLGAPKAHYGHTEGAAGVCGLLAAACALSHRDTPSVRHLRDLNPFVASAFETGRECGPGAPRTRCSSILFVRDSTVETAATSSFGMSGVNAHACICSRHQKPRLKFSASFIWVRDANQFSYRPCLHVMLMQWSALPTNGAHEDKIELDMDGTRVIPFLHDHQVLGRSLFPAAASLAVMVAATMCANDSELHGYVVIANVILSTPLVVSTIPYRNEAVPSTTVEVRKSADGSIRLLSTSPSPSSFIVTHVSGTVRRHFTGFASLVAFDATTLLAHVDFFPKGQSLPQSNTVAQLMSSANESGWINIEAVDNAIHLVASIADASDLFKSRDDQQGKIYRGHVPAAIDSCAFGYDASTSSMHVEHQFASAQQVASPEDRARRSNHSLGDGTRSLVSIKNILIKSSASKDASTMTTKVISKATSSMRMDVNHYIRWETIPGAPVIAHLAAKPYYMFIAENKRIPIRLRVVSEVASAVAASQTLLAERILTTFKVNTRGALPISSSISVMHMSSHPMNTRGSTLHALIRTLSQEVPGIEGVAIDGDPMDLIRLYQSTDTCTTNQADARQRHDTTIRGAAESMSKIVRMWQMRPSSLKVIEGERRFDIPAPQQGYAIHIIASSPSLHDIVGFTLGAKAANTLAACAFCAFVGSVVQVGARILKTSTITVGEAVVGLHYGHVSRAITAHDHYVAALPSNIANVPCIMAAQFSAALLERLDALRCSNMMDKHVMISQVVNITALEVADGLGYSKSAKKNLLTADDVHVAFNCVIRQQQTIKDILFILRTPSFDEAFTVSPKTALITGGSGALGARTGLWLATRSKANKIILTGQSGRALDSQMTLSNLVSTATIVSIAKADISNMEGVALQTDMVACNAAGFTTFHASGLLADRKLLSQHMETVRGVFAPKHSGAVRLVTSPPILFGASGPTIFFSSIASLLGAAGQSNYATANASLDSASRFHRFSGVPSMSVNWGGWSGGGMADEFILRRAARMGIATVSPTKGLNALFTTLEDNLADVSISPFEWHVFLSYLPKPTPPLFDYVADTTSTDIVFQLTGFVLDSITGSTRTTTLLSYIQNNNVSSTENFALSSSIPAKEKITLKTRNNSEVRLAAISNDILSVVREVAAVNIAPDEPLMDSGIDSLAGVELKNKIEELYGVELPATAAFDYPSVHALSVFLASQLDEDDAKQTFSSSPDIITRAPQIPTMASPNHHLSSSIVVMDWSGSAACTASPLSTIAASDDISTIPHDRWNHDIAGGSNPSESVTPASTSAARFGAWVPDVAYFDAVVFATSHVEAALMDPQQRHLLESCYALCTAPGSTIAFFTAAGLPGASSPSSDSIAVAIGLSVMDYSRIVPETFGCPPSPYLGTGNAVSVVCGRLSYTFGLKGPSFAVDTACSSSLVATHMAGNIIVEDGVSGLEMAGTTTGAVAGGVALIFAPQASTIFAAAGMLAPDGRCKTLDAKADGYVRTEAVWALILWNASPSNSSSQMMVDVAVVIRLTPTLLASSAVNQDGRSSSLTAPNGPSQQEVLTAAARTAHTLTNRPADMLEMHGTGTALGDPIEFGAAFTVAKEARDAFARLVRNGTSDSLVTPHDDCIITLSAIKGSVGHSEAAAGMWGLLNAICQLHTRGRGHPLHLRNLNTYILQVIKRRVDSCPTAAAGRQKSCAPVRHEENPGCICGVSSFAFQGTNAHSIVASRVLTMPPRSIAGGHRVSLFDQGQVWCFPLTKHVLNACISVEPDLVVIMSDLTAPRYLAWINDHMCYGRRTLHPTILMELTSAIAHATLQPMNFDVTYCRKVALPTLNCSLQGRISIDVDVRHGGLVVRETCRSQCLLACGVGQIHTFITNHIVSKILHQTKHATYTSYVMSSRWNDCSNSNTASSALVSTGLRQLISAVDALCFTVSPNAYNFSSEGDTVGLRAKGSNVFACCNRWILIGVKVSVINRVINCAQIESKMMGESMMSRAVSVARFSSTRVQQFLSHIFAVWPPSLSNKLPSHHPANARIQGVFASDTSNAISINILADVLRVLNAASRTEDAKPITKNTNLVDVGFGSLQVIEVRRQLEEVAPFGYNLIEFAAVDNATPASLVGHMMAFSDGGRNSIDTDLAPLRRKDILAFRIIPYIGLIFTFVFFTQISLFSKVMAG